MSVEGMSFMKKKIFISLLLLVMFSINNISFAFYESLPKDIGSNSSIMEIVNPEEKESISYSEDYVISCVAEPGTEITLYEKYDDTLYVPMTLDNEAITSVVGDSGLFLFTLTFKANSQNRIMFFAQNGSKYQTEFRTISTEEKEVEEIIEYRVMNIRDFVVTKY